MPTIKEVAKMAEVSSATVSRFLNNSGYVGEEARKRILKVIEETGYVPSENAKSLRTKQTKVIGVILPKISTETSSRLVRGLDEVLAKEGYQILLANSGLNADKEIEHLRLLKSRDVDGIILSATTNGAGLKAEIQRLDIPVVVVGQEVDDTPNVIFDEYQAAKDMVKHLIDHGHERIGFIGVSEEDPAVGVLRKKGYLQAMQEKNFPIEESWIEKGIFDVESGAVAMERMMGAAVRPTAVFAVTDRLAIGAMNYVKSIGLRIPEDIAFAGIGASELSRYITPSLTTMDYQNKESGRVAAGLILEAIKRGGSSPEKRLINVRLLQGDSV
ncbi:LacI family DNA-binding transcriptional regulator [Rossellomorea marisflavi]|uniref:LacI family DNA-binding transcriptional regulator n=1 Tax=Rossellomorea marisflavi TaxID=189381 RepID=UPI001EE33C34|nr:LacI family DNA-binding transcriptional regulator [Rossellomorea marisflavi]UKS66509.1 LacI family transcriptional regulator [Rossellomorea marisflavi]WJV17763.1 LacI family DNA-binding transcriptional regulator [Rossellomorea marisflavi]